MSHEYNACHTTCAFFLYCTGILGMGSFRSQSQCMGWKLYHCVPRRALPFHLFRHFCCRMYQLATMHSVIDRQTERRHYEANDCVIKLFAIISKSCTESTWLPWSVPQFWLSEHQPKTSVNQVFGAGPQPAADAYADFSASSQCLSSASHWALLSQ